MEFLANHVDRNQQVTVLKDELAIRYAKLQMQYYALHKEMLDDNSGYVELTLY